MFKTPHPSAAKPPQAPDERLSPLPMYLEPFQPGPELDKADDTPPIETNPPQATDEDLPLPPPPVRPEPVKPGLKVDAADANKSPEYSDNADARPLRNMYENRETPPSFADVIRSSIERMPPAGTLHVDPVAAKNAKAAADEESCDRVGSDVPGDVNERKTPAANDVPKGSDQPGGKTGDASRAIAKANKFSFSPRKAASSLISFFLSAIIFVGAFLGQMTSSAKVMFAQILRCVMSRDAAKAVDTPEPEIDKDTPKPDIGKVAQNADDPSDLTGLNLSKAFSDEAEEEERQSGLAKGSALQMEVGLCSGSDNGNSTSVSDRKEDSPKRYFSGPKAIRVGYGVALCAFASAILMYYNDVLLEGGLRVAQESSIVVQEEDHVLDRSSVKDFNLTLTRAKTNKDAFVEHFLCLSTQTASLFSVPLWEFNLSPASFETVEEEFIDDQTINQIPPSGLRAFLILSVAMSLLCAFAFKSTRPSASVKPTAERRNREKDKQKLTGIWTEEEHEQFLVGYNVHGSRWKLVSAFVPTRTHAQVSSHGSYWLKVRSPDKMKKARRMPLARNATPKRSKSKTPITPLSESSTKSTPRKSNKNGSMPIKGILSEKDNNLMYKNMTPRSADRTRRIRITKEGCKSDPIKKRVRILAP